MTLAVQTDSFTRFHFEGPKHKYRSLHQALISARILEPARGLEGTRQSTARRLPGIRSPGAEKTASYLVVRPGLMSNQGAWA